MSESFWPVDREGSNNEQGFRDHRGVPQMPIFALATELESGVAIVGNPRSPLNWHASKRFTQNKENKRWAGSAGPVI